MKPRDATRRRAGGHESGDVREPESEKVTPAPVDGPDGESVYPNDRSPGAIKGGLDSRRQALIRRYIAEHLGEPLSRQRLARFACLSVPHFSSAFALSFGIPPCRYVRLSRIERAKRLLEDSALSITEIAHVVGFASHGHFSASFRLVSGMSPSEYRSRQRADEPG